MTETEFMKTSWSDEEDNALQGLPLRAQIIYLRGIRRYMNYKTGICGGPERRISLKMLSEIAESYFNRQRDTPGKKEVIVSLDQLKKAGLLERIEDKDFLIFFLPKADLDNSVQNNHGTTTAQPRHNHGTDHGTEKLNNDVAFSDNHSIDLNSELLPCIETTAHIRNTGNRKQDNSYLEKGDKSPLTPQKPKFELPNFVNPEAWAEFEQHRKEIKKSLSDSARKKAVKQLQGFTFDQQQEIIDYSILGKYPGLYPDRIAQKSPGSATNRNQGSPNNTTKGGSHYERKSRVSPDAWYDTDF